MSINLESNKADSPASLKRKTPSLPSPNSPERTITPSLSTHSSGKKLKRLELPTDESGSDSLSPQIPSAFERQIHLSPSGFPLGTPALSFPMARKPFRRPGFPQLTLTLPGKSSPPSPLLTQSPALSIGRGSDSEQTSKIEFVNLEDIPPAVFPAPVPKGHEYYLNYFRSRCHIGQFPLQQRVAEFLQEQEVVLTRVVSSGANGITFEGQQKGAPVIFKALFHAVAINENRGNHLLEGLSHPSLIQIKQICRSGNQLLGVLMEKARGITLKRLTLSSNDDCFTFLATGSSDALRTTMIPARQFLKIAKGVAAGLDFLKQNRLLHRDIQPNNILIDQEGNVKIIDFDLLRKEDRTCTEIVGTQSYQAPEIPWASIFEPYSYPVDAYSFG